MRRGEPTPEEALARDIAELREQIDRIEGLDRGGEDLRDTLARLEEAAEELGRGHEELFRVTVRARSILDAAVEGILTIDEKGTVGYINPAAERMFGYDSGELEGANVKVLMPEPHRSEHDGYLARYLATGERHIIGIGREVMGRRKDGTLFPLDLAVSETTCGGVRTFIGTVRDVTERKQTEEMLQRERDFAERLVETAQAIVLVLDCEGRIVRFNRYLEKVSGYRLEEVRGRDWFTTFLPERDRQRSRRAFRDTLGGRPVRGGVIPILTKDGQEREIEWYDTPLKDDGILGVLAVGQDITERRRLEEQFLQAQKMEAMGRLAGGVAHDFNTLLASIIGYADLLLAEVAGGDPRRRAVEQIRRCGDRGAALTRQLLTFSRQQAAEPRRLDLNTVVADLRDMLGRLLGANIEVEERLDPDLGQVEADPGQLQQVLLNLAINAGDAMPEGGRLTLETANVERDGKRAVMVAVADTGCGMDEAIRGRIFEPFFTTKEPGKGTGLGLSTVYGIVTASGGGIAVESHPGEGSVFRVFLPRAEPAAAVEVEVGDDNDNDMAAANDGDGGGSESVLLVEDDEMFRDLLRDVLEGQGYRVLVARRPAEALELWHRHGDELDLLISDVMMPGMSGDELARRLLEGRPDLRVLLMSGYSDEILAEQGAAVPGSAFIEKPFRPAEFALAVRQLLDAAPASGR